MLPVYGRSGAPKTRGNAIPPFWRLWGAVILRRATPGRSPYPGEAHPLVPTDRPVPYKDFSDLYEEMSGKGESAHRVDGCAWIDQVTLKVHAMKILARERCGRILSTKTQQGHSMRTHSYLDARLLGAPRTKTSAVHHAQSNEHTAGITSQPTQNSQRILEPPSTCVSRSAATGHSCI